jgi:DNA polymerase bacteriophage-type
MSSYLYLDIETRSDLDIRKVGSYVYAKHPSTKVLCCAWALGQDDRVHLNAPFTATMSQALEAEAERGIILVAHNADFERNVLHHPGPWLDTATLAAAMGLPRSLEDLAAFLFPGDPRYQKDMSGNAVMMKLSRPKKDRTFWTPEEKPEDFQRLYAYCKQDVEVMRACHQKLLPLSEKEYRVWAVTTAMNDRGVQVDLPSVDLAQGYLKDKLTKLTARFESAVGCKPKSYKKVAAALGLPNTKRHTVRKALRKPGTPTGILKLFRKLTRSSTAKLKALQDRTSADGRLRGALVYAGAERTSRWSSHGVQLQNIARGLGQETDLAFQALELGILEECFSGQLRPAPDPPLDEIGVVVEMLRGFLHDPDGLLVGDYAQIEARVLAWIAGQADLLEAFRQHEDPYCVMASRIYEEPVTKDQKEKRFMGKQAVLGAGYGLGPGKHERSDEKGHLIPATGFVRMLDETYDVQVTEEFAKRVISIYRQANPKIVQLWDRLQRAWTYAAVQHVKLAAIPGEVKLAVGYEVVDDVEYVFFQLPSDRKLRYASPRCDADEKLTYFGRDKSGNWTRIKTYGGKLSENVTQAISRDILAEALLRLHEAGAPLLLTVHDEIVCGHWDRKRFEELLLQPPPWAHGLPIEAETFESVRYRK